jgi:predicted regulator of Ras-like GTPase activity (Roadblock/LC7/MglB family)
MMQTDTTDQLSWLLDNLVSQVEDVHQALVRQTIIEMDSAFLFITAAGEGTSLAVMSSADVNAGLITYEMAMLVRRMGKYLAAKPRFPGQA